MKTVVCNGKGSGHPCNAASHDERSLDDPPGRCGSRVHRSQPAQSHGQSHANVLIDTDAVAVGDWKNRSARVHDLHEPGMKADLFAQLFEPGAVEIRHARRNQQTIGTARFHGVPEFFPSFLGAEMPDPVHLGHGVLAFHPGRQPLKIHTLTAWIHRRSKGLRQRGAVLLKHHGRLSP